MSNRTILHPQLYGGKDCDGTAFRTERCNAQSCPKVQKPEPVDCEWSTILVWTECSTTCGWGIKTSEKTISRQALNGGKECLGDAIQTQKCKLRDCPGRTFFINITILRELYSRSGYKIIYTCRLYHIF